jgi:hypothetical protein
VWYLGRWCSQIAAHGTQNPQAQLADGSIAATAELRFFVPAETVNTNEQVSKKKREEEIV